MRTRDLKPGFFRDQGLAELPPITRLLYAGLWCFADKRGRLPDNPKLIKADIFPYENVPIEKHLRLLLEAGFIERYEAGGQHCIWIPKFRVHQHPHPKEPESVLPQSPNEDDLGNGKVTEKQRSFREEERGEPVPIPSNHQPPTTEPSITSLPSGPSNHRPPSSAAALVERWVERIGPLSAKDADEFVTMAGKVDESWFLEAIEETEEKAETAEWPYCRAVLKRCLEVGKSPKGKKRPKATAGSARAQFAARIG